MYSSGCIMSKASPDRLSVESGFGGSPSHSYEEMEDSDSLTNDQFMGLGFEVLVSDDDIHTTCTNNKTNGQFDQLNSLLEYVSGYDQSLFKSENNSDCGNITVFDLELDSDSENSSRNDLNYDINLNVSDKSQSQSIASTVPVTQSLLNMPYQVSQQTSQKETDLFPITVTHLKEASQSQEPVLTSFNNTCISKNNVPVLVSSCNSKIAEQSAKADHKHQHYTRSREIKNYKFTSIKEDPLSGKKQNITLPNAGAYINPIDEDNFDKNKKNAHQAKINREKKKVYIAQLEKSVNDLRSENISLKEKEKVWDDEKKNMALEIEYLKSVLANQSTLSSLLKNLDGVKGVHLSNSFKRKGDDTSQLVSNKRQKQNTGGVCLHVAGEEVSLEFCAKCSSNAAV